MRILSAWNVIYFYIDTLGVDILVTLSAQPNPFRSTTNITFAMKETGFTRVTVLDIRGRQVKTLLDGIQPAGNRVVTWDGSTDSGAPVSPGVYFVKIETQGEVRTQKVVLKP